METNEKTPEKDVNQARCSLDSCIENNSPTVECSKCGRLVHYKCTKLPVYELERYTKPKPCQYKCRGCVHVPKDLYAILTKFIEEDTTQNEVDVLSTTMSEMNLVDWKEELKKHQEEISKLKQELKQCKTTIKSYQENEVELQIAIEDLKTSSMNQEQQMKFNPDYTLVKNLEDSLDEKLEMIGQSLKTTLLGTLKESLVREVQEIKESSRKTEEKLEEATKTYATALTSKIENKVVQEKSDDTIKAIVTQARNEEKTEERERNLRSANIILHGVAVDDSMGNSEKGKQLDTEFISKFLEVVDESVIPKAISRLGKHDNNKSRPIKVVLRNGKDKEKVMRNLSKLKGIEALNGIRVTEDYTMEERKLVKSWVDKAKQKNEEEPEDSEIVWTVRGTPKNGLRLWWRWKNPPANHQ